MKEGGKVKSRGGGGVMQQRKGEEEREGGIRWLPGGGYLFEGARKGKNGARATIPIGRDGLERGHDVRGWGKGFGVKGGRSPTISSGTR